MPPQKIESVSRVEVTKMNSPLFCEDSSRFVLFPIQYPDVWEFVQKQRKADWKEHDVNLTQDLADWNRLTLDEQFFIKHVLAFFAASDGIVLENLAMRFMGEVQMPEARFFYVEQAHIEAVHSIMYSLLIDTYVKDPAEKQRLFRAIENYPCIARKAEWAQRYIQSTANFSTRLLAFACVEGIFFSGSFCAIFWLRERGLMPGLAVSNELISRDEGLHCEFAVWLYTRYVECLPQEEVHRIVADAVAIEEEFIVEALPCKLLGMNSEMMREYVRYIADRLLKQLGYDPLYGAKQPFAFMDKICVASVPNFFDVNVSNYQMSIGEATSYNFDEELDF